jgi:hypothetical protein
MTRQPKDITDHAEAAAIELERAAKALRGGMPPEDLGERVVNIGRMMWRRT